MTERDLFNYVLIMVLIFMGTFIQSCKDDDPTPALPVVETTDVIDITQTTAVGGGVVSTDGGAKVTGYGICWSTNTNPTLDDDFTVDGTGTGEFASPLSGLTAETTYFVRAYATNKAGTSYGDEVSFTTLAQTIPELTTTEITSVTRSSASGGGNITSDGGTEVLARGLCWSKNPAPTIEDDITSDGAGTGSFTSSLTDLGADSTYYVRAYAINAVGTAYGQEISFTTSGAEFADVETVEVTNVTKYSATISANIATDGGADVTERGITISHNPNPVVEDQSISNGSGTGSFDTEARDLEPATTYYVRAYAKNSAGTSYGEELSFTTLAPTVPEIQTVEITDITSNSANIVSNILNDGGAEVTARGITWGNNPNPTIEDASISNGYGIGFYTTSFDEIEPSSTYYVRAYATNSVGTAYGNELSFTTLPPSLPEVSTIEVTHIGKASAYVSGSVDNDGGATVTARGICWGTSPSPTIANDFVDNGTGVGTYSGFIDGLATETIYYVRAYATNSVGTAYGQEISFTSAAFDTYVAGYVNDNNANLIPVYLKNNILTSLSLPSGAISGEGKSIFVDGADVYVAGHVNMGTYRRAIYWKNGAPIPLTNHTNYSDARGIAVLNGDVYVVGHSNYRAAYWKNEVEVVLLPNNSSGATDIMTANGDVYISGYGYPDGQSTSIAYYWKNDVVVELTDGSISTTATSIEVIGADVYVAGDEYPAGAPVVGKYWVNGAVNSLTATNARTYAIGVSGSDIYVSGVDYSTNYSTTQAGYWLNGTPVSLENASDVHAYDLVVRDGSVYVAGTNESSNSMVIYKDQAIITEIPGVTAIDLYLD